MASEQIMQEVTDVFRDVLDNESLTLNRNTTALDVEEWDSITHIQIIVALEKKYKIKFTAAEIQSFKNVGELVDTVERKTTA
jgi:acyl carrier protein